MICLTLSKSTISECLESVKRNRAFIDICELRLDLLSPEEQKMAFSFPSQVDIPVILTLRRIQDGGKCNLTEKARRQLLSYTLEKGSFSYVDIEDDVKRNDVELLAREKGVKIIRSFHDFSGIPDDIFLRIKRLREKGDVAKVAVTVKSISDMITLFRVSEELPDCEKIVIGMGDYGVPTRILYKRLGSLLTFTSEDSVAPGHLPPEKLKLLYKADRIDEKTAIYGIIGNPVLHSSSPNIHNPGFEAIHYNAVYVPFLVDSVQAFFQLAERIRIRGFSVTIPYKNEVLRYLGNITREVMQIGACNTVVRVPNMWKGMNTDYYGFLAPIDGDIESGRVRNAMVIGAGGAAKSIVKALRNKGVKVTILNRTIERAKDLALSNLCQYDSIDNASKYENKMDLIVQTTSVGLYPDVEKNPIEGFKFSGREIVYDIIYKPQYTKLLLEAERSGCRIHFGREMLLEQGKLQVEAFTGYHYPKNLNPEI